MTAVPDTLHVTDQGPEGGDEFCWPAWFQKSTEPVFVLDGQQHMVFVNRAWETLAGIPLTEARQLSCRRKRPVNADVDRQTTLEYVFTPPTEVLEGQPGWTHRRTPGLQDHHQWWDIAFLPFHGPAGLLFILGRVTVVRPVATSGATSVPEGALLLREAVNRGYTLETLASDLPEMNRLVEQIRLAAHVRVPVFLVGEPGTGKRWTARVIHALGGAGPQPLVVLDCARLPAEVSAGVLFGEGNLVSQVNAGTIYFHEPSYLPRELQLRLCHLLTMQDETEGPSAVPPPRLMAGCSTDPGEEVRAGRLLGQLFCRMSPLLIRLLPVRERRADLPRLVQRLLERAGEAAEHRVTGLTPAAWEVLQTYPWPGNLAELYQVLVLASVHASQTHIDLDDLPLFLRLDRMTGSVTPSPLPLKTLLEQVEKRLIALALHKMGGNKSRAAELLSIWRPLLIRRIKTLGLQVPEHKKGKKKRSQGD